MDAYRLKKKKVYVVYFPIKYQYYNTRERSLNKQAAVYDQRMHSNGELHLCCENTLKIYI